MIIFFLANQFTVMGQNRQISIDGGIGVSYPTGTFANQSANNSNAGLAENGITASLQVHYQVLKKTDVFIGYRYSYNNVNSTLMKSQISSSVPSGTPVSIFTGKWKSVSFIAGLERDLFVNRSETMTLSFRAGVGIDFTSNPFFTIIIEQASFPSITKQESKIANSFAWKAGLKLTRYFNKLYINCNTDFFSSNPKFSNISINSSAGSFTNSFQQKINLADLTLGIGVLL